MRERLARIITSRSRLEALYGEGYFNNLLKALQIWKNALAAEGIVVEEPFVLSDDLPDGDLPRRLKNRLAHLNRRPADAVIILGGPDVVPFYPLCSPEFLVPADGDRQVLSDDPYVAFDRHNVLNKPECSLGRLPDGGPNHPDLLIDLLAASTRYRSSAVSVTWRPIAFASQAWSEQSRLAFGFPDDLLYTSPPCVLPGYAQQGAGESIDPGWLAAHNLHYYNVHGARSNMVWYGQCDPAEYDCQGHRGLVPVMEAPAVPSLPNSLIFSEASYSASLNSATEANLALRFLEQGALCYIGATAAVYCSNSNSSLQAADQMAQLFFEGLRQNKLGRAQLSVGEIFKRAKLGFPIRDDFDRKTLVAFALFGDPTLIPFQR